MRILDERFLTVHPATALWWRQRKLCERCKHLEQVTDASGKGILMQCGKASTWSAFGRQDHRACVQARSEHGCCGAEAKLYEARGKG